MVACTTSVEIWEATCATLAASTFFEPIKIERDRQKFVDGAHKFNNPIEIVDLESHALWPDEDRMIISIAHRKGPR